eukprot:gene6885-7660_t
MSYERIGGDFVHQAIEKIGFGNFQVLVLLTCGLQMFLRASSLCVDSLLEPFLRCEWHLSFFAATWIVTAQGIGRIFGGILFGKLSDKYGRKRLMFFLLTVQLLLQILNALSTGYAMMIISKFFIGFFQSADFIAFAYILEVMPVEGRSSLWVVESYYITGFLFSMAAAMITLPYLTWRWFIVISIVLPLVIYIFLLSFLPESPKFLFKSGKSKEAVSVLTEMAERNRFDTEEFQEFVKQFGLEEKQQTKQQLDKNPEETTDKAETSTSDLVKSILVVASCRGMADCLSALVNLGVIQFNGSSVKQKYPHCAHGLHPEYHGYLHAFMVIGMPFFYYLSKKPRLMSFKCLLVAFMLNMIPFYWNLKGLNFIICLTFLMVLLATFFVLQNVYQAEALPTSHRAFGQGIAYCVGNFGFMLTSFIVDYAYHVSFVIPFAVLQGLTIIVFIIFALFAKETKGIELK